MNKFIITISLFFIGYTAFSQNGSSAFTINGRLLQDSCGETIILRGVNHGNIWSIELGIPEFSEIAKTNANCVRICLERQHASSYNDQGEPIYEDLRGGQIDTVIQAALDLNLIPILELHDFTDGSTQHSRVQANLDSAVMFWTNPSILAVLKKHSRFLILNLANEPEHYEDTEQEFYNACSSAVAAIRNAGLNVPIMIDGMHWGQDHTFFINNGNGTNLLQGDPEHKLLFSVHTYWQTTDVSDNEMTSRFLSMYNSNLPFVIGEFAYDTGDSCFQTINYHLIMDLCQQYRIGYLYWWWGFFNPSSNNCLSMTHSGTYTGLADQGLDVAVIYSNSIKNTSVKSYLITNGSCTTGINDNNKSFEFSVSPNPCEGSFSINSSVELADVKIIDLLGNDVKLTKTDATSFSLNSASTGVYILMIKLSNGKQITQKLIVQ